MTDILDEAEPWLAICGACDLGMPEPCICPTGDYRPIMLKLYYEIERLRREQDTP